MPKRTQVYPADLRFTQLDICEVFQHGVHAGESVVDVVKKLREGIISPSSLFPLTVHQISDGICWCENNRSLYALRQAGYSSKIPVVLKQNDFRSRKQNDAVEETLKRSGFLPRIRGSDTARGALEDSSVKEGTSSSFLTKSLVGLSGGFLACFAGYKLNEYLSRDNEKEEYEKQ